MCVHDEFARKLGDVMDVSVIRARSRRSKPDIPAVYRYQPLQLEIRYPRSGVSIKIERQPR